MSSSSSLRVTADNLWTRVRHVALLVRRTAPGPALVRLVCVLAAALALQVSAPGSVAGSSQTFLLAPFAVGVGLFPRTRWVSVTAFLTFGLWLLSTTGTDQPPSYVRLGVVAAALYVMHASAALAAGLPYDATVSVPTMRRWAVRMGTVAVAGSGAGLVTMAVVARLPTVQSVIGPVVGSAIALALVGVVVWVARQS